MIQYKKTAADYIFDSFNYIMLTLLMLVTLYPLYYILVASLSSAAEIAKHGSMMIIPKGFTFEAYKSVLSNKMILLGYRNTLLYVTVGTSLNLIMTIFGAYALSRKWLMGKKIFMLMIVVTMFFGGGLIPTFLVIQKLKLLNNFWALIIPGAVSAWNIIMMRTYFLGIPDSMEESARVDGANDFQILFKIILPLSKPIIAVMILFYAVGHWNSWFGASIYLQQRRDLWPLQLILREILIQGRTADMGAINTSTNQAQIAKNLKYATVIVSTLPILMVYPFLQKYFVQGIMIGSLKE